MNSLNPPTLHDIITVARSKLLDEKNWLKGMFATDQNGFGVVVEETTKDDIACMCASAAIAYATKCAYPELAFGHGVMGQLRVRANSLLNGIVQDDPAGPWADFAAFNDDPAVTHSQMLALFDAALAQA